jgi:hypothetical protein
MSLIDQAALSLQNVAPDAPHCPFCMDTWSSPFTVGYINVGRRHLVGSLEEVVEMVLQHRPDILFLGDLVTSRDHIGRLKKRLESALCDEWFVITNISALPGRPMGIGAVVHCSLANRITDCVIHHPDPSVPEEGKAEWEAAIAGRIQCIKVTCLNSPFTWQFVGVYQHVAARTNRIARARVMAALSSLVVKARAEGHHVALLGDFNAAPPGGRWGYSRWSAAVKEDQTMTDWALKAGLTEVFQRGKPNPTWRPNEGPRTAALDRVLISHSDLPNLELTVKWHCPAVPADCI